MKQLFTFVALIFALNANAQDQQFKVEASRQTWVEVSNNLDSVISFADNCESCPHGATERAKYRLYLIKNYFYAQLRPQIMKADSTRNAAAAVSAAKKNDLPSKPKKEKDQEDDEH